MEIRRITDLSNIKMALFLKAYPIDAAQAQARRKKDKEKIDNFVKTYLGNGNEEAGFQILNSEITAAMRTSCKHPRGPLAHRCVPFVCCTRYEWWQQCGFRNMNACYYPLLWRIGNFVNNLLGAPSESDDGRARLKGLE